MGEEFQESDVVFQDSAVDYIGADCGGDGYSTSRRESGKGRGKRRKLTAAGKSSSVPVSIPVKAARSERDYDDGEDGEMVPPHVIVGRRVAGKMMALSICTGKGRVLKGRELREFRNLVLRVTGFLET